jgi:hypothetical protein
MVSIGSGIYELKNKAQYQKENKKLDFLVKIGEYSGRENNTSHKNQPK